MTCRNVYNLQIRLNLERAVVLVNLKGLVGGCIPGGIEHLLLPDPELGNPGGHYENNAETLRRACGQLGIGFSALGGQGSTTPAFDPINARLVPRWAGGALVNPFLGGWRMEGQLRTHATARFSTRTLVFAATANHRHYAALGRWIEGSDEQVAPKLSVLLRFPEYDSRRGRWYATAHLTRRGLARLEKAARRREIRLGADRKPDRGQHVAPAVRNSGSSVYGQDQANRVTVRTRLGVEEAGTNPRIYADRTDRS